MKQVIKLMMVVALGVAASSCNDESFNEVEKTVLEYDLQSTTDDDEIEENRPGQS